MLETVKSNFRGLERNWQIMLLSLKCVNILRMTTEGGVIGDGVVSKPEQGRQVIGHLMYALLFT